MIMKVLLGIMAFNNLGGFITDFCCVAPILLLQLQEKQRLIDFAEALRSKLNYFDELENVRFDCWLD